MSTDPAVLMGLNTEASYLIGAGQVTDHVQPAVLGTPEMIRLIEMSCANLVRPHLTDEETTVGTAVCVTHDAGAYEGETIVIRAGVSETIRRRVRFDVEVTVDARRVGGGTHEAAIVRRPDVR